MTNSNRTLVAGLLDRTGSMSSSKQATEDGWRELIAGQKKLSGECLVTLAQFDLPGGFIGYAEIATPPNSVVEWVYKNTPIAEVPEFVLVPRGTTPLYDACGIFVTEIGKQLETLPEDERPGTVILVIMTDGGENASREWTQKAVHDLITQQRETYNWKVMFLGANIDAVSVGASLGVSRGASITYDSHNYTANRAVYQAAGVYTEALRGPQLVADAAEAKGFSDTDRAAAMGRDEIKPDEEKDEKLRRIGLSKTGSRK